MKTEQQMREEKAPTPETGEALAEYVASLVDREHDYGTCVYAMSLAAAAAFNHVAHKLGVTGFQASCADLDFLRRVRGLEGPFMVVDSKKMLYPQYDLLGDVVRASEAWLPWAAGEARRLLADSDRAFVAERVWKHWEKLAEMEPEREDAQ